MPGRVLRQTQINLWKKQLLEGAKDVFVDGRSKPPAAPADEPDTAVERKKVQEP